MDVTSTGCGWSQTYGNLRFFVSTRAPSWQYTAAKDGREHRTDLEDIITIDQAVAGVCRLQVVDGLTHVTFSGEQHSFQTILAAVDLHAVMCKIMSEHRVLHSARVDPQARDDRSLFLLISHVCVCVGGRGAHVLSLADLHQPHEDLLVAQFRVAQHSTAALDRLDDFRALVGRQSEAR